MLQLEVGEVRALGGVLKSVQVPTARMGASSSKLKGKMGPTGED